MNIAVLASTKGTDLQAIIDCIQTGKLKAQLKVVLSDKKSCFALKRAAQAGYSTEFIDPSLFTRSAFDRKVIETLEKYAIDLVVLVGYMRIIGAEMVSHYRNRIINVHPALIPAFSGKEYYGRSVHKAVIERGVKVTGCTIHFVNEECDGGPIILQKTVDVGHNDTPESLKEKVQTLEKKWYPEVIQWIMDGNVHLQGKSVYIKGKSKV